MVEDQLKYIIVLWNANSFHQHAEKVKTFFNLDKLDILLSETHLQNRLYFHTPKYNTYHTNRPDEKAHGRTSMKI